MNRLLLRYEGTAPLQTRYTVWARINSVVFEHAFNACTLAAAIRTAQRMEPRGYITNCGERP